MGSNSRSQSLPILLDRQTGQTLAIIPNSPALGCRSYPRGYCARLHMPRQGRRRRGADTNATMGGLAVYRRARRYVCPTIVGCCLLVTCLGCRCPRPRHGLILRGDWSLELNRLPWRNGGSGTCATRQGAEAEPFGPYLPGGDIPQEALPRAGQRLGPRSACGNCGGVLEGVGAERSVVQAGYHNHPRFHPVPTRPAFLPRPHQYSMIDGISPTESHPTGAPSDGNSQRVEPPPPAPEPEVIPTPPASSEPDWKPLGSGTADPASSALNGTLIPAVDRRLESIAQAQIASSAWVGQINR